MSTSNHKGCPSLKMGKLYECSQRKPQNQLSRWSYFNVTHGTLLIGKRLETYTTFLVNLIMFTIHYYFASWRRVHSNKWLLWCVFLQYFCTLKCYLGLVNCCMFHIILFKQLHYHCVHLKEVSSHNICSNNVLLFSFLMFSLFLHQPDYVCKLVWILLKFSESLIIIIIS